MSIVLAVLLGLPLLLARIAAPLLIALAIFQTLRVDTPLHQQGMTGMNKPAVMQGFLCN